MQEIVTNVLLAIVIVTAAVFILVVSKRDGNRMTKKQKTMMVRILISRCV